MKLACESCHAKYSIADDRVAGKTFKIRCKKCGFVIVLRGAHVDAPVPAASGGWHAVVDGTQLGPFARDELVRRRDAGELDDAALVWREGMPDWAALGSIDELRAQPSAATLVSAAEDNRLRNERNETSVLFTLSSLQRLAGDPVKPAASVLREEGSGLIDIRALASTWARPEVRTPPGSIADVPIDASTNIIDPIVLVPTPVRGRLDRRLVFALVAMLAMVLALGTVLVVVLTRDSTAAQAAVIATAPAPVPPRVVEPPVVERAAVEAPPPTSPPPPVAESPAPPPAKAKASTKRRQAPPATPAVLAPPAKRETCTEVSCTVNDYAGACCDPYRPRKASTTSAADLPENLDRAAFAKGLATFDAQRCGASSPAKGDVSVSIKITAEGTVSGVTIKGSPDAALSACVERETKRGTFAKTKRGGSYAYVWRF